MCWPWFGPLERNPQEVRGQVEDGLKAPAHGLVRAVDWEIDDIAEEDGDLCVSFRLDAPDGLPAGRTRRRCACCSASASA